MKQEKGNGEILEASNTVLCLPLRYRKRISFLEKIGKVLGVVVSDLFLETLLSTPFFLLPISSVLILIFSTMTTDVPWDDVLKKQKKQIQ